MNVLVLNQDFSPLAVCSVERAFTLYFTGKVDLLHQYETEPLRSISQSYPKPSVIKIKRYISVPYRSVTLTRHNVFIRDNFTCQYCGSKKDLTIDHIVPRSKGGKTTWKNVITACESCNIKKGSQDLESCGLFLRKSAFKPSPFLYLSDKNGLVRREWEEYLILKN